ncbi:ankyrin repeat-containing domain protein [Apiosordaria backusii]|uniref:Ankyrin repeat-containing domain protein n=1 Tax=Apiosordaria backusii TaxID=314023 RepID=A0AA40ECK5_9PEZI|nr:ankyrin repeat-containing domain protein [Apiosordaria backusii]
MPPLGNRRVDWEAHRGIFEDLYLVQDKPLAEVIEIMKRDFNVDATTKMYKKRIKAWGMFKNVNGDEMLAMMRIREHRRKQGKRTQFYLRGKPVLDSKIRRFATRHGVVLDNEDYFGDVPAALRGITFSTPEPDDHHESTTILRHDDTLHLSSSISGADATSLGCFMGSPDTELLPPSPYEYTGASWDMPTSPTDWPVPDTTPVVSEQHLPATAYNGPTTQQVYAWLDEGHLSRFDESNHSTGHVSPFSANLEIAHDTINDTTAQSFAYEQHLEIHQAAERSPNSLGLAVPLVNQAQMPSWDRSPLHDAVTNNDIALTRTLLGEGMSPNLTVRDGTTALHLAASQRNTDLVRLLMDHGANLDSLTDRGESVLFFAVRSHAHRGHSTLAPWVGYPPIPYGGSYDDDTTMQTINELFNSPSTLSRLIASLTLANETGMTPLMAAAEGGFFSTVVSLLQRGAQVNSEDHAGHTALKYAASSNRRDIVRLLLEADTQVYAGRLDYILKLADKNFGGWHPCGDQFWSPSPEVGDNLIAEEIVRLCREKGCVKGLLHLAELRHKTHALELFVAARQRLEHELNQAG